MNTTSWTAAGAVEGEPGLSGGVGSGRLWERWLCSVWRGRRDAALRPVCVVSFHSLHHHLQRPPPPSHPYLLSNEVSPVSKHHTYPRIAKYLFPPPRPHFARLHHVRIAQRRLFHVLSLTLRRLGLSPTTRMTLTFPAVAALPAVQHQAAHQGPPLATPKPQPSRPKSTTPWAS